MDTHSKREKEIRSILFTIRSQWKRHVVLYTYTFTRKTQSLKIHAYDTE